MNSKITRKNVEAQIKTLFGTADLYKSYNATRARTGWNVRPFGKNEIYLGATLQDAYWNLQERIDTQAQLAELG